MQFRSKGTYFGASQDTTNFARSGRLSDVRSLIIHRLEPCKPRPSNLGGQLARLRNIFGTPLSGSKRRSGANAQPFANRAPRQPSCAKLDDALDVYFAPWAPFCKSKRKWHCYHVDPQARFSLPEACAICSLTPFLKRTRPRLDHAGTLTWNEIKGRGPVAAW